LLVLWLATLHGAARTLHCVAIEENLLQYRNKVLRKPIGITSVAMPPNQILVLKFCLLQHFFAYCNALGEKPCGARGRFTHKTMTKQVEFLEHFIAKHASSIMNHRTLQEKVMSSVEESSSVESKHMPSLGLTHEPSPKPRTPKERLLVTPQNFLFWVVHRKHKLK
jgi:hypothetical protein